MAFPSATGTTASLGNAWEKATQTASMIKQRAQAVRAASAAGSIGASQILDMLVLFAQCKTTLTAAAAVPGVAAYAQEQVNNPALDVAGAFSAMVTQLDATRDWVTTNFPKDGSGYLLDRTLGEDGRWIDRQFSSATLATFRTVLDALIATID